MLDGAGLSSGRSDEGRIGCDGERDDPARGRALALEARVDPEHADDRYLRRAEGRWRDGVDDGLAGAPVQHHADRVRPGLGDCRRPFDRRASGFDAAGAGEHEGRRRLHAPDLDRHALRLGQRERDRRGVTDAVAVRADRGEQRAVAGERRAAVRRAESSGRR